MTSTENTEPAPESDEPAGTDDHAAEVAPQKPRRPSKTTLVVLGISALIVGLVWWNNMPSPLQTAQEACAEQGHDGANYLEHSDELSVAGAWREEGGEVTSLGQSQGDSVSCVLGELDAPNRVIDAMNGTSSLQGQQSAEWDGLRAYWDYHPSTGMKITIERT